MLSGVAEVGELDPKAIRPNHLIITIYTHINQASKQWKTIYSGDFLSLRIS